jgi:nitroreductase
MAATVPSLSDRTAIEIVQAAVAAPSMHNTQPWRFRVRTRTEEIQLYAEPRRALPVADPHSRALLLGCGAALFNLRLAVSHRGREPVVRLLPRPAVPSLLASLRLAGPRRCPASDRELYQAIWLRHTNRGPFSATPVPGQAIRDMTDAARLEGAELWFLSEYDTTRVLGLVAEADRLGEADPPRRTELARWAGGEPGQPDGVPAAAFGPRVAGRMLPLRDFGAGGPARTRPTAEFEAHPHLAVLLTRSDTRADWLRAGQALQRVLLTATIHGLSASFLNQPVEQDDLRWLLRPSDAGTGNVHMLIRFGFGRPVPGSPRRPADHVLEFTRD